MFDSSTGDADTSRRFVPESTIPRQLATLFVACVILSGAILILTLAGSRGSILPPLTLYYVITGFYLHSNAVAFGLPSLLLIANCVPLLYCKRFGVPVHIQLQLLLAVFGSALYFACFWSIGIEQWSRSCTLGVAVVNIVIVAGLVCIAWFVHKRAWSSFVSTLWTVPPLILWLCAFAFPVLGHLP
jgi:hypothetical protein